MTAYNVVSPTELAEGQSEDITVVKANFDAIAAVINGGLDGTNIAASSALTVTSLSLSQNSKTALQLTGAAAGITFGGDTTLYRGAAAMLKTDGLLWSATDGVAAPAFIAPNLAAGGGAFGAKRAADSLNRFTINDSGKLQWGPGGASPSDTSLYRQAAGVLRTDGGFEVIGHIRAGSLVAANTNGVNAGVKLPIYNINDVLMGYVQLYSA